MCICAAFKLGYKDFLRSLWPKLFKHLLQKSILLLTLIYSLLSAHAGCITKSNCCFNKLFSISFFQSTFENHFVIFFSFIDWLLYQYDDTLDCWCLFDHLQRVTHSFITARSCVIIQLHILYFLLSNRASSLKHWSLAFPF
jgi:hypothetical protein